MNRRSVNHVNEKLCRRIPGPLLPAAVAASLAFILVTALSSAPSARAQEPPEERDEIASGEVDRGVEKQEGLNFFDTGPLRVREQFLLSQGFLAFDPAAGDVLNKGRWQIDLVQSGTNTWVKSDSVEDVLEARDSRAPLPLEQLRAIEPVSGEGIYFADGELYRTSVAVRVGVGNGIQLGLTVPVLNFQGGFGDDLIEEFHSSTGFSQAGRLGLPRDGYTVYIRDPEGNELFRDRDPGTGLGDITLSLKGRIPVASDRWKLSLEGLAKLDTGDDRDLYASGNEDYGAQVHLTRYFAHSCIHGSAGVIRLGDSEVFHLDEQTLLSGMLGYERALGSALSVIVQATVSQSPFEDLNIEGLDELAFLVDFGVKKGFNEHLVGFVAMSENFLTFGSSADFGLHLGLTHTF